MAEPLFVQTEGLRGFSQTHRGVADALSGLAAPDAGGVESSHGPIATAVSAALAEVLGVRQDTMETTSRSGNKLAELLLQAAQAYERGDQRGATALQAAANAMDGSTPAPSANPAAATTTGTATAGADGAGMAGQLAGQIGQQVAQLGQLAAQAVLAPLQALAQPLQQLPQQLTQAGQSAALRDDAGTTAQPDDEGADINATPERNTVRVPEHRDDSGPGETPGAGRAPAATPPDQPRPEPTPPEPSRPAQTRPASD